MSFFYENTLSIDVCIEGQIRTIYFPKLPYCRDLSNQIINNFEDSVDRISTHSKVSGLMEQAPEIKIYMKHENFLRNKYKRFLIWDLIAGRIETWRDLSFILVFNNFIIVEIIFFNKIKKPIGFNPKYINFNYTS